MTVADLTFVCQAFPHLLEKGLVLPGDDLVNPLEIKPGNQPVGFGCLEAGEA